MKTTIYFLVIIFSLQLSFAQNSLVKIDTIYSSEGIEHRILNYDPKKAGNHFNLALKCKIKADSLIAAHFDLMYFREHIFLNASKSYWYRIKQDETKTQIFNQNNKNLNKVKLVYSIMIGNSKPNNLIEITLCCKDDIELLHSKGIPDSSGYIINIDYNDAIRIANKKGFKDVFVSKDLENYSNETDSLFLKFSQENNYEWIVNKTLKRKIEEQVGSCSLITTNSKVLIINADTGKTKIRKFKNTTGSLHWF